MKLSIDNIKRSENSNVGSGIDTKQNADAQERARNSNSEQRRKHNQINLPERTKRRRYSIVLPLGNSLARLIPQLVSKTKNTVKDLDASNDLKFVRLKTTKN